jgi:hypothetical protein
VATLPLYETNLLQLLQRDVSNVCAWPKLTCRPAAWPSAIRQN